MNLRRNKNNYNNFMERSKIIYHYRSPRQIIRRNNFKTVSPAPMKDHSSELFRIQVNTPTFYRPVIPQSIVPSPSKTVISSNKPKRLRISYKPNSSVYNKLNVRLTLNTLEFTKQTYTEPRTGTRSQMRKTIDFTNKKKSLNIQEPLEARGCSMNFVSISN